MTKKTPAKAAPKGVPKTKPAKPITGAVATRPRINNKHCPQVTFKGDVRKSGARMKFTLDNGVNYSGTVLEAISADGLTVCELSEGPTAVAPK